MENHITSHELAIAGFVIGVIGVGLTSWLHFRVSRIESKRRDDQIKHFEKLVKSNLQEAADIYKSVNMIANRQTFNPEETEDKTIKLQNFLSKKHESIQNLVRDTKFYASMLGLIDSPTFDIKDVIEKIGWLTSEFYILENSVERNMLHWVNYEQQLRENRKTIESSLTFLNTS